MRSLTAAISVSSLLASLHIWAQRFLTLATEEGKQAGQRLLSMLGLALLATGLAITGWLGLLAGIVLALVENKIVSWEVALGIATLLSFAGAGGLAIMLMQRSGMPLFAATRRHLGPRRNRGDVNAGSPPLVPYELEVEEGRMAAYAEYEVLRRRLRRRLGSPLIISGVMLAGIAVGYLGRGRRQSKGQLDHGRQSAWTQVLGSVQVLTSLWIALHVADRSDGGGKATARQRHGS